jgi:hypothetical protein
LIGGYIAVYFSNRNSTQVTERGTQLNVA